MRWIIEHSRYVVVLPALGSMVGGLILIVIGLWQVISAAVKLAQTSVDLKESTVSVLAAVDTLLLATVLMVIGYGLYELFVDDTVQLPPWLHIRSLEDLKVKLISVVVAVIAVVFLGELVEGKDAQATMMIGVGAGALVLALAAFTFATRNSGKQPAVKNAPGAQGSDTDAAD